MKTPLWQRAGKRYLLPELPGTWKFTRSVLHREPVEWLLSGLSLNNSGFSSDFQVTYFSILLAVPKPYVRSPVFHHLGEGTSRGLWEAFESLEDAEPVMREILDLTRTEALPLLDRLGNIDGFTDFTVEQARTHAHDPNALEELCYVRLIQDDVDGALEAADATKQAVHEQTIQWVIDVGIRVAAIAEAARRSRQEAMEVLRQQANFSRSGLGLPVLA